MSMIKALGRYAEISDAQPAELSNNLQWDMDNTNQPIGMG